GSDRGEGVWLRERGASPRPPRVGRPAEVEPELLDEPRLADAGLAGQQDDLPAALARPPPTLHEQSPLLHPPDERRETRRGKPAPYADQSLDPVQCDRLRDTLDRLGAALRHHE